jgi:hypothetical protein
MPARSDAEAEQLKKKAELESQRDAELAALDKSLFNSESAFTGDMEGVTYQQRVSYISDSYDGSISACEEKLSTLGFSETKVLAEIQTFSYSIFREKAPVRTLGSVYPKTYVRGPRTIGGSMVFTVFNQHVLAEILNVDVSAYNTGARDFDRYQYTTNLSDQLPPLDFTLLFANEYGAISYMGLYGVEFVQEGGTFSIEDIFSESVIQYVARDLDPLRGVMAANRGRNGIQQGWGMTASQLSNEQSVATRRNNFI